MQLHIFKCDWREAITLNNVALEGDAWELMSREVVFKLELEGCPEGRVLDPRNPDRWVDEKYFKGVETPLQHPHWSPSSPFRVVDEGGVRVLEFWGKGDGCLLVGSEFWVDYAVEVELRKMWVTSYPTMDDELCTTGRSGIILRYQTLRRYYYYCLEGLDRAVLYRREDDVYVPLAEEYFSIDRSKYYRLMAACKGDRIRCYLNGVKLFEVRDAAFKRGKVGVRVNTRTRIRKWQVYMSSEEVELFRRSLESYNRSLSKASERYPRPTLWRKLNLSEYGLSKRFVIGDFVEGGKQILILSGRSDPPELALVGLGGDLIWRREYPKFRRPASSWDVKIGDVDGDGLHEIAAISSGEGLVLIDGATGDLISEAEVPEVSVYAGSSHKQPAGKRVYICNLDGWSLPRDIVVFDDDVSGLWAYDENLDPLWSVIVSEPTGHHVSFWDVDDDGREEILAGYCLIDHDGSTIWQVEGSEYFEMIGGGRHADCVAIGDFSGDPETVEAALAGGNEGFLLVDGKSGKVLRRHRVGHAQCLSVGNYRPDLSGLQIWVGNRWGNFGTLNLFNWNGDRLCMFEPDNIGQGGLPVNWSGRGDELLLITSSRRAAGLYDGHGRKVVAFQSELLDALYASGAPGVFVGDVVNDRRDEMVFAANGTMYILTQDRPYPKGERIYSPRRTTERFGHPIVSLPGWAVNEV